MSDAEKSQKEEVSNNTEKEPLTLEDIDKAFSLAWVELFKQKHELETLIDSKFAEQNELIKKIFLELIAINKKLGGTHG
jgi:hypothetical protein